MSDGMTAPPRVGVPAQPPPISAPEPIDRPGILGDLAARRQEILTAQVWTHWVPRWEEPRVKIRCRPVEHQFLKKAALLQERGSKSQDPKKTAETELDTNADILINACIEIVAVLPDGQETGLGPNGARTRFDQDAAVSLGMPPEVGSRAVCRALFIADGDMLAAARALGEWSGYREEDTDQDLEGE